MKPYVICHMLSSIDGHALTDGWARPFKKNAGDLYEKLAQQFKFDAWICGRVTMQEIAHGDDYQRGLAKAPVPRIHYFANRNADCYAISIDPHGKVAWKSNVALASHVVAVVTEAVSDDYLAYLKSINVSYIFGGKTEIDLAHVIATLANELGTKRLIVEGGPAVSGSFVNAGLVDEVSVLILPLIDGRGEHPASFEIAKDVWSQPTYLTLESADIQEGGGVWLRYKKQ
ncbi:dihydrofolate reductase family protein [Glaciimonas sp. CA11.2]|uniref:RibD family protein n=1 Tax=unclassified Glaciimonas TaxID=2644401 RepID=UPI002AB52C79|nr:MULTISPECIES: dihydrofolate reductase family protein [unclassified Glaciimonas]MDY7547366.1 dihydrofolate reductase family protein [Glaciimonas sp. CA11.2]MEB0012603.1 dihydrofolate reductase family protein [Glaciimonas sp. Cout2]MEB0083954.1 dihydrofolate reductase family protein [Glaciimonas sp. Gout2]MEB0162569.1 dihydrofolate reductase family protein [Glaciimonas sp. CA11.2]